MNQSRIALLTFDFEMFLGRSGSVEKCLVEPVESLISLFSRENIKATFFVDATFLTFLKKESLKNTFCCVANLIQRLMEKGHRIELHIHPQWLDAIYDMKEKQFLFPEYRYYTLRGCSESLREEIFSESIHNLRSICQEIDSDYKILGYRAGGWCIDPFSTISKFFIEYGLKFDSSVLPQIAKNGEIQSFNYEDISQDKGYYLFSEDIHKPLKNGIFIEFPVSVYKASPFMKISRVASRNLNSSMAVPFGDGASIDTFRTEQNCNYKFIADKLFKTNYEFCTIDGYCNKDNLCNIVSKRAVTTIVGHPKSLTMRSLDTINSLSKTGVSFQTINNFIDTQL